MAVQKPMGGPATNHGTGRSPPNDCSSAATFLRLIIEHLLPPRWAVMALIALTVVYLAPWAVNRWLEQVAVLLDKPWGLRQRYEAAKAEAEAKRMG